MPPFRKKCGRLCVLVVESERSVAIGLSEMIADVSAGYEVRLACSGIEGLKKIQNGVVNIVLLAEKLVDMSGCTFVEILEGLNIFKEPACVLISENTSDLKQSNHSALNSVAVINSPIDREQLIFALDQAIEQEIMNDKIAFNMFLGSVLWALMPVAFILGAVVRML